MKKTAEKEIKSLQTELKNVENLEQLKQVKAMYLSKSTFFNSLKDTLKKTKKKKEYGEILKFYSSNVYKLLEQKKDELENNFLLEEKENTLLTCDRILLERKEGTIHPLSVLTFQVMDYFDEQKYEFAHGVEVEIEKYNFDILNLPLGHPSRSMHDTFYLESNQLLRTHSTNVTARELESLNGKELSSYAVGTVFRNDDNDATHSFQFNQIDIFRTSPIINLSNLKWTLNSLLRILFEKNLEIRYRPSYFPFTEPSYEVDIECPHCHNSGCRICSYTGWIEVLGSGMLHPNVILNVGKNPDKMQGFAAGIGLERIAMIKWLISDIRNFYVNDLLFLKNYNKEKK
ncbi:MAG: phenylalanine--tRNA ligase subunit alpha [Mycoplasmataceae bacterium]|nr:phenylalanine--tRNA ligase subunit alpha [Mycoplasmataceae bacterium]